jgi:hypothetical protein
MFDDRDVRSSRRQRARTLSLSALGLTMALAASNRASAEECPADGPKPRPKPLAAEGFSITTKLGATLTWNENRNVVGQTSGSTVTFGYDVDAHATWLRGPHEWRSTLDLAQGLARTARLPLLIKSQDLLRFDTVYLHRLATWAGPFVRLGGDGPLLAGYDDRIAATTYVVNDRRGAQTIVVTRHLPLTTMARPFNFKQSLGAFVRAKRSQPVNLELRLGGSARQTLADGQYAIRDLSDTPAIEVVELGNFRQLGPEAVASAWGKLRSGTISYRAGVDVMVPAHHTFYTVAHSDAALDLTNIDAFASITVKVVDWASIDYVLRIVRQPQLVAETQVRSNLVLTFGFQRTLWTRLAEVDNPLDMGHDDPTQVVPQRERVVTEGGN